MSTSHVLHDSNGDEFHLNQNYIRYGNRILDASFIATISVKKHKLLFNNFKQNTTLPVLNVPFKKESDARHALNLCLDFYEVASGNPYYGETDQRNEVFLADAFGGVMHVTPDFLKYRDRVLSSSDVRCVNVKGRRILVNHFKGNLGVPTMCVHFADKTAAARALNSIQSILWNIPQECEDLDEDVTPDTEVGQVGKAMELLEKPADPAFLTFMVVSASFMLALTFLRAILGPVDVVEEL